ncbi:MAG: DNA polymerase III subunit gamma/tau [Clostridia bacterium]|nr:DNA polymerase III subunit gamma/tau [Clostridia bacterium]
MSEHIALYRKWRPLTFSDVIGQEHITRTLQNEVTSGKTGHAFLFCGGRGTGKTSTARILSRALNCLSPVNGDPCNECSSCKGILSGEIMDIIEIDAASNNGVDNIRDLRSEARFAAAEAKYKVYIIDEVHMLSGGAFNALLKLLEEPPEGVIFILATTETHKVPATILSRCQRFDFRRITAEDIASRIVYVAGKENISIDEGAAHLIARSADGALRDALSLLDQCSAISDSITEEGVYSLLGLTEKNFLYRTVRSIATNDAKRTLSMVDEFIASGKSAAKFIDSLTDYFTTLLRFAVSETVFSDYTDEEKEEFHLASTEMSKERMMFCIDTLLKASSDLRFMTNDRVMLDIAVIKMCNPTYASDNDALIMRLSELEKKVASGVAFAPAESAAAAFKAPTLPSIRKKAAAIKKIEPTSEDIKTISDKWKDICKDTSNIKLLIALERSSVREDDGTLVLLFDDTDKIMLDILAQEDTKNALSALIEKHTGFSPKFIARLASYYEDESTVSEEDPLNLIDEETEESVPAPESEPSVSSPSPAHIAPDEENEEEEEEFSFEENDDDDEHEEF